MKKLLLAGSLALLVVGLVVTVAVARNSNGNKHLSAGLEGFQEVPSISSKAEGDIDLKLNGSSIQYRLKYGGFETDVLFAHIHFAQEGVNGAVAAFLCGGGGKPACPTRSGTVTGTITTADVQAITAQNLAAGDIAALIRAIKAGYAYANVHSTKFPGGEIRGQIGDDDDDHHGDHNGERHGNHNGGDHDEDGD
jgi:CHRD domain-containing protein